MTSDLRSAPIITLSLASSNSACVTIRLLRRAAVRAASLTRFIRSAPEKPGVPRAMVLRLISGASGTLRIWTLRIFSRPPTSGLGTTTWRSKRPGRSSAGSSTSGRLVAANGVDFVDEYDAGCVLLGLLEHVAHAARTDAHEHLDEVGARDGEEGHV